MGIKRLFIVKNLNLHTSNYLILSEQNRLGKRMFNKKMNKSNVLLCSLPLVSTMALAQETITLEKIMSDPTWIGAAPQSSKWLPDSQHVFYKTKVKDSVIAQPHVLNVKSGNETNPDLKDIHRYDFRSAVYADNYAAYVFEGDVYLWNLSDSKVTQITHTSARESNLSFIGSDTLAYWQGDVGFSYTISNNTTKEFVKLEMAKAPAAPKGPKDIIAKEQHKLIDYVANKFKEQVERHEYKNRLSENNAYADKTTFYFGKGNRVVSKALSPTGDKLIVVTAKQTPWRGEGDIMPNYIGQDGRIVSEKVRRRVSDSKPNPQSFWLVDLNSQTKTELKTSDLPDFDKDVLKAVKSENAKAEGEKYKSEKSPRAINLLVDWTWSQSPIQWHGSGEQVALMLEAWDNKDRWITTVDFDKSKFVNQHQLHDEAWINYTFNDFGWFNNSKTLYFLSEQSGYSHIYTKALGKRKKAKQVTSGSFEVSNLYLKKDDSEFVFRANVNHPGEYRVYSVKTGDKKNKRPKALTNWLGNSDYSISPDESKLLVTHSSMLRHDDLYLVDLNTGKTSQLTDTVSNEFKAMPWSAPEIVAVPSSNQDLPIYSRVYYPKDYKQGEARRAVIFNHGAGYLQNSHKGWSGYFREFMFHNMLAQQGYVVMDMDYRASKGYGRDWRTAIYRQMGTPEIQDLKDGVNWLVENANVDRNRIGTYGGSYGGFMTFMALFNEPELFQAGAALRPVSDWAHYNDAYTSNILNRPKDDMIAYRRSSPIYFAEGLQKPLLINAPMIDNNVFFLDVVRLVQRLIELEKENFETAIYPVEPHGFVQPSSWLDEYRRIYKLFETHL